MLRAETDVRNRLPNVQVSSSGSVFWTPHFEFKSACQLDFVNFPYDEHTCDMWFQSISNSKSKLDIIPYTATSHNNTIDLSTYLDSYRDSQKWEIVDHKADLFQRSSDAGIRLMYSQRPALRFRFHLRRQAGFKAVLLTAPCIMVSLMIAVTFCLPSVRTDRHLIGNSLAAYKS